MLLATALVAHADIISTNGLVIIAASGRRAEFPYQPGPPTAGHLRGETGHPPERAADDRHRHHCGRNRCEQLFLRCQLGYRGRREHVGHIQHADSRGYLQRRS